MRVEKTEQNIEHTSLHQRWPTVEASRQFEIREKHESLQGKGYEREHRVHRHQGGVQLSRLPSSAGEGFIVEEAVDVTEALMDAHVDLPVGETGRHHGDDISEKKHEHSVRFSSPCCGPCELALCVFVGGSDESETSHQRGG